MKKQDKRFRQRIAQLEKDKKEAVVEKKKQTTLLVMRHVDGVATLAERVKLRQILLEAQDRIEARKLEATGEAS